MIKSKQASWQSFGRMIWLPKLLINVLQGYEDRGRLKALWRDVFLTRALTLTCLLLSVIGIASAILGSALSLRFRTPFPFRDMVEMMAFLDGNPKIWLGESFTQFHDMEHLPALPTFIWYADRLLSGSSGLLPLLLSHAALATTAFLAVRNWAPRASLRRPATWFIPASALAMMFSLTNWFNLTWEKQLHVSMSLLFALLSASFAGRLSSTDALRTKPGARRYLALTTFSAWGAAFSFGYGLPAMPIITIHGVLARWSLRRVIFCAAMLVLLASAYLSFLGLRERGLMGLIHFSPDPYDTIAYVARFIAGVIAATDLHTLLSTDRSKLALVSGVALLSLYGLGATRLYVRSYWYGRRLQRSQTVSLIVTSVCVAIALMTHLSRPNETQGLVERYYIVSTLFILSLPGLFASGKAWVTTNRKERAGFVALSSIFIALSLLGHLANHTRLYLRWHDSAVAAIGADMGIHLPGQSKLIGPPLHDWRTKTVEVWAAHRVRLKKHGRYKPFEWYGQNIMVLFDVVTRQECIGNTERIERIPNYENKYIFVGWIHHGATGWIIPEWIVVTESSGRIVGLGAPGRGSDEGWGWTHKHFPNRLSPFARNSGIAGYLSASPGTAIEFFAIKDNKAWRISAGHVPT